MKKMIAPEEALAEVLMRATPLPPCEVSVAAAIGCVLAEDLRADRDYPPFDRAMMDGYACHVCDAGHTVPVTGEVPAGHVNEAPIAVGAAVQIMTGAPCPPGTETVAPVEQVTRNNGHVRLPSLLVPKANIARRGSECAQGDIVAPAGTRITPLVIANLASFGHARVRVVPRPHCHVITTGAEIVRGAGPLAAGQIRDSNGPMLEALLDEMRIPFTHAHADDTEASLMEALKRADGADVVLLTGGVSAGAYDLVPEALVKAGVEPVFHKVLQKPGKPLYFGHRGHTLFFGLPGNPLAVHHCFHRYAVPAMRALMSQSPGHPGDAGYLAEPVIARGERTHFRLCRVEHAHGQLTLHPLSGKGSADIYAMTRAQAYIMVPPGPDGLAPQTLIPFEWLGEPPWNP